LSEILDSLQLTANEKQVYLTLLSSGQLSVPEIAELLDIKIVEVEEAVKGLIAKNLAYTNPSIIEKFTGIYPLVSLADKAKESLETIKSIGAEINKFAAEKTEVIDQIVKQQKESILQITTSAKEEVRVATDASVKEISTELDKLIEEIGQILNSEEHQISSLSLNTQSELTKHFQETTEAAGNTISSAVSDIANSLSESKETIAKAFTTSSGKVEDAATTFENSLLQSLENNFSDYSAITNEIQQKVQKAIQEYNASAKDNMTLHSQLVNENYSTVIESVNSKLGVHNKETNQILEERIRNITQSIGEMNDDFAKIIRERLLGVKREYNQLIESFSRNVESLFTEANTQLETLIATKTRTNEEKLTNLFNLLKENLEKSANETKQEIKAKEIRIGNDLRSATETTQRKMTEINDKLNMELTNSFNKATTDFSTTKNNMKDTVSRAKNDIVTKFAEARDAAIASIEKEFEEKERIFTEISSKIIDDIRELNATSEVKTKGFIKETEESAKNTIGRIEMPAKTLLNRGKQTALKYVHEQADLVNRTIDKAKTGLEDAIVSETSNIKTQFKGYGDRFIESNKTIERILSSLELTYRELVSRIKDMPRQKANTVTIIGKDAVLNQMETILKKVKSTVTLIYPTIADIHIDTLLNSNPRTRIIVISDFDTFKNADVIRKLMSKENIQLKSLVLSSTQKPYYAIGRDAEEGLVGTIDDSGEVIAITSNSQAFVELINTEIINGILTPKTKRVVLPDND